MTAPDRVRPTQPPHAPSPRARLFRARLYSPPPRDRFVRGLYHSQAIYRVHTMGCPVPGSGSSTLQDAQYPEGYQCARGCRRRCRRRVRRWTVQEHHLQAQAVDAVVWYVAGFSVCVQLLLVLTDPVDCLKTEGHTLLDTLANGSSTHAARLADELTYALKQVSAVIETIPVNIIKASAEYATLADAAREGGVRRAPAGTVVILADEAREFAQVGFQSCVV